MRTEQGKGEQSVQRKRNERKNKKTSRQSKKEGRRDKQGSWRDEPPQEKRERFEGGSVQSAEVHGSPEQTLANRGAVVRVRVGQGRGQQHQDVKCDRSILGFQLRNPSLL